MILRTNKRRTSYPVFGASGFVFGFKKYVVDGQIKY